MASAVENFRTKSTNFQHAFSSWSAFKAYVEAPITELDQHGRVVRRDEARWSNEDLDPTPPAKRTWTWVNYTTFYWGLSFGNWTLGSTMIGIGLNWWESIVVIFVAQMISSLAMFFNSRCASVYHLGYPIVGRACFGMWGSFYVVGARAALAIIWYGVQLSSGASFVAVMLRCVFGHNYTDIPNHIPESQGITSATMLSFFLFWLFHLPFCALRPYQLREFFWFKSIVMCISVFGLFIFCMVNTRGDIGSIGTLYAGTASSERGWFYMKCINAAMGNSATLITNQPDVARWSRTKTGAMWSQIISNPIAVTVSASFGILGTAAINNTWGLRTASTAIWNPWDLLGGILDRYWSAGSRTAIFLCAFSWTFSILGTNIAANMIPFGSDVTMLLPKYFTIPRGQFLVALISFGICPWKILASASIFTTFLSGYGLFMGSVVAVMIADYWILTKGNVFVGFLYDPSSYNKHYYYTKGWNWQAYCAYICGIALPFPGFIGTLGAPVSLQASRLGDLGWLISFTTSFVIYIALCLVRPTKNQKLIKEAGLGWEQSASDEIITADGTHVVETGSGVYVEQQVAEGVSGVDVEQQTVAAVGYQEKQF